MIPATLLRPHPRAGGKRNLIEQSDPQWVDLAIALGFEPIR
jgi:hypothetical protein